VSERPSRKERNEDLRRKWRAVPLWGRIAYVVSFFAAMIVGFIVPRPLTFPVVIGTWLAAYYLMGRHYDRHPE
jgi:cobalamin synthase